MRRRLGFYSGKLTAMTAGTARRDADMVHRPSRKGGGVAMAGLAGHRGRNVIRRRFAQRRSAVVTTGTTRGDTGVIHGPGGKAAGTGMACVALKRGRDVGCGFLHHSGQLAVVTRRATSRSTRMVKYCPQKAGGAFVA